MKQPKILLEPKQKQALYLSTGLLWLSGAFWLYLSVEDPMRPLWMKIHGAVAMVFLISFGTLLVRHVPAGWQQNRQRFFGGGLLTICGVLALTGWGLYYLGDERFRHWTSFAHSLLGLALPILILLHIKLGKQS